MKYLAGCILSLFFYQAFPQEPVFKNYGTEDGLPSSEVYQVLQDYKGYMWFGTDRGLARFDGYTFETLTNAEGLPDNTIFGLTQDIDEKIWYRSYSSQIGYVLNGKPHLYKHNNKVKTLAGGRLIHFFMNDGKGGIKFGCVKGKGIEQISIDKNGGVSQLENGEPGVKYIFIYPNGQSTYYGPVYPKRISIHFSGSDKLLHSIPLSGRSFDFAVWSAKNKYGDIAFYTDGDVFLMNEHTCRKLTDNKTRLLSIMFDTKDRLWLGLRDKGLVCYERNDNYHEAKNYLHSLSVSGMTEDQESGLWFTTLENGVYYLPPSFTLSYNSDNYLPIPKVSRIINAGDNVKMILSDFTLWSKYDNREKPVQENLSTQVLDIGFDSSESIYFYNVIARGNKLKNDDKNIYLSQHSTIYVGKNCIWALGEATVFKYDKKGKLLLNINFPAITRITCLLEQGEDTLLIGTLGGLYQYTQTAGVEKIGLRELSDIRIADIAKINDSFLVLSTVGYGILLIRKDNYVVAEQLTTKDDLPSNLCNDILVDNDSKLWVGTNKGLCCIQNLTNISTRKIYTIDAYNGLISNEVNKMCIHGPDIWVATTKGVSVINRSDYLKDSFDIPVYIEQIAVNNKPVSIQQPQEFDYYDNNIRFTLKGINYQYAGQLMYKYRLKGINDNWTVTSNNIIEYNTLPPGEYMFEATTIVPHHGKGLNSVAYAVVINKAYWQTWWFIAIILLLVILSIVIIIHYRTRAIKRQTQMASELDAFRDKAMRAQMNPHFIYNSMNSIQNYIRKNDQDTSIRFLAKFSRLMRLVFNNSSEILVPMCLELETVVLYTDMQAMRFPDKFTFHLNISDNVKTERLLIPPFVIQPFVENAIYHGFSSGSVQGTIWVNIMREGDAICIEIKDNGVGRKQADMINKKKSRYGFYNERKYTGISITKSRIQHAWNIADERSTITITDLFDGNNNPAGTLVKFYLPLVYAKDDNS